MAEKNKVNDNLMSVISVLFAICLIALVFHQAYDTVTEEYTTETALSYSSADTISFRGVYIRDESVINEYINGVLCYEVSDGSKVGNGSVIANVYSSENEIEIVEQIEAVREEISLLESAQNPGTTSTAEPQFIADLISEDYQSLTTALAKSSVSDIADLRDNILTHMCIYQISIGKENNYNTRINNLYSELSTLLSKQVSAKKTIYSSDSGYFVSYTDGYESELNTDMTDELTVADIKEIIANGGTKASSSTIEIGKLVKGYNWKIAGVIDNSAHVYNAGDEVTLSFSSVSDVVTAIIERLDETENEDEYIIVLRCEEMTHDLVQKRVERVEMTLNDFEGIKVPRNAIRFNQNNEKGVYVLWGQRVLFKKLDVIFESDDYVLSKITADEDYVCIYDEIILEGVDTADYMANLDDDEKLDATVDISDGIIRYTSEDVEETTVTTTVVTEAVIEEDEDEGSIDDSEEEALHFE